MTNLHPLPKLPGKGRAVNERCVQCGCRVHRIGGGCQRRLVNLRRRILDLQAPVTSQRRRIGVVGGQSPRELSNVGEYGRSTLILPL
jgi:hypothetical protein